MGKQNFSNIGEDIKNIVQDAVNTGDFRRLSKDIGHTVDNALDEAKKSIKWAKDYRNNSNQYANPDSTGYQSGYRNGESRNQDARNRESRNRDARNRDLRNNTVQNKINNYANNMNYSNRNQVSRTYVKNAVIPGKAVLVGRVSGILCTIFGNIGVGVLGVAVIVLMVAGHLLGMDEFFATIGLGILPFLIISVFVLAKGNRIRKRIRRMQQYTTQLGGRNYCEIKDLSISTGLSTRYIVKDLQKMISIGMFPEGHIDEKKTSFMLDNESYKLYLDLQESMKQAEVNKQKKLEAQKQEEEKQQETVKAAKDLPGEARSVIEEGRQFIHKIKEANFAIPGEEVSKKLDRLEDVIGKIFDYVELHPDQIPEIRKFMEYYLPTTLKLLEAYKEFDRQPIQGENISTAKSEIEKTLDTINLAFENLLDDLFEDAAMDVSTDISVLNTMLAQEGLTEKNLKSLIK
ncbi:5-bromo-4-chloroindolyl phosphate hydrolysis family protein [Anaerocolumna sp. AGMB13025]|uniref:5-bromo-4-chloroindolyl phosphate hydrolysis family protein n=1 Tax=Anaerocolumna sp. AGMB13025 TaxID=3039116 RepID=UPI00241F9AE3|nr:5-bromo-4-chloroindolyl phosphate hydrolysis family protein [Anaerocolumna sp. AGMB13025]WFR56677.1 5-bromo-4-chloroindolyl phosphate hydrolysis family protein [Anaerocolumna sp. AGMB13025]